MVSVLSFASVHKCSTQESMLSDLEENKKCNLRWNVAAGVWM